MSFLEHQHIEFENVLSYRTRTDSERLGKLLEFIKRNVDALDLEITGNIIFTIQEMYEFSNRCILGLEVLAPVNKAFESGERYVYKPKFRLVNAVSVRCSSNFSDLIKAKNDMNLYISKKKLRAISGVYYIAEFNEDCVLAETCDAVVSIDDNML